MPCNVLITAASRRVALVQAFKRAVERRGGGRIVVTDVNPLSPAVHAADRAYLVPLSSAPSYLDEILEIAMAEQVSLVVPTIDDELERFGAERDRFERHGIRVATSDERTAAVCNDKHATSAVLASHGIAAAASWLPDALPSPMPLPAFVKPRVGRGSAGAFMARTPRELAFFTSYVTRPVVQAYLDGPEYTIDVLGDFDGRPLSVVPRERVVIRSGVIDRGRTSADPALIQLGLACANALRFVGAANVQCRVVGGTPTVFEINPRFAGGIPLTIAAGADFPQMLVDLARGLPVAPAIGAFEPDYWMTSYETSFFLDDDRVAALRASAGGRLKEVA